MVVFLWWCFCGVLCGGVGLDRTTVKNCGKMNVFDRTEPDYGGKLW